ncbi:response regulator transcription factor [Jiangella alkaliphila]|uniref:DNA-binding response regulator, OmpR family, contains REC and winged-helix (WHTH) domain n=1 Tax=Jiangella alkaliphila TaxID=419479 RepID=A0A1H2LUU8_9ACTN|nr:response regulator transcription factor [Jiangella alkaliphila]SDU84767.1 DNA-binding response regulator, OmpR family, contains REC and winged-helix (wHTH) domain [Jiangella alkaliphila]
METARRILLVEDDATVAEVVVAYLRRAGHTVEHAADGESGLRAFAARRPDLVVLDLMLPGVDGREVIRRIRAAGAVPVIMLTALGAEHDRVHGLELGADDYVAKPFSPRELVLRVRSVLRRGSGDGAGHEPLRDGDLELDPRARRVTRGGVEVRLTVREFDLLAHLLVHAGQAFTRAELLRDVWGWEVGDQSTVTVHVRHLREKLEDRPDQPRRLVTVWGVGYRWERSP